MLGAGAGALPSLLVQDDTWPFDASLVAGRPIDVVCVGHALVDRLAHVSLDGVRAVRLEPGGMTLVDGERSSEIERAFSSWSQVAGGSAANTAAGIASLGGSPVFAGAVGDDTDGRWYSADLERAGVGCSVASVASGEPTGVCHVLVTDRGERSMATSLGAAGELPLESVELAGVERAKAVYFEGYLLDPPLGAAAVARSLEMARAASTLVSLSLSDRLLVERRASRISDLVFGGAVDLVFGNGDEAMALTGAESQSEAIARLRRPGLAAVVTLGASGAVAVLPDDEIFVPASQPVRVEDTTGAGDLFAAGCMWGVTHDLGPKASLRLGAFAAAEVISHLGARPAVALEAAAAGLLRALTR